MLKSLLYRICPSLAHWLHAYRARQLFRREYGALQEKVASVLYPDGNCQVLSGPFAGLRYINATAWGSLTPRWIGAYEAELHRVIKDIIKRSYDTILDIGAAEGYYAVGLTRASTASKVYAFDLDPIARRQCQTIAALNNVEERLHIAGECTHLILSDRLEGQSLVICDIEGAEHFFLNPDLCPALKGCDILVELHEPLLDANELEALLISRFKNTHNIEVIPQKERDLTEYKAIAPDLDYETLSLALNEWRGLPQSWLWMQVK